MKAVKRSKYGSPDVLTIQEVEIPIPKENEVLVRVYATTVNRTDCGVLRGKPFIIRFFSGLLKPTTELTGTDFAGQIEQVGKNVRLFKAGDKIMGFGGIRYGSHAQYLALPETRPIIIIPDNLTYDQAAACLEGAFYAFNMVTKLNPRAGQKALVNGATGAIGSSIVQFLKFYDTYITAVCGGENSELVRSLGADRIIDYTVDDFTNDTGKYDFVFDAVGKSTFARCKPLLTKSGIYTSSDGFQNVFLALITSLFGGKKVVFDIPKNARVFLIFIKDLVEKESFRPVIDRTYPIDRIVEAYKYVETGQKIGNVIINLQ